MKNLKYTLVMIFVSLFSVYAQEENKSITMNITGRYIAEGMCGKSIGACVKSIESVDNQNSKSADYTLIKKILKPLKTNQNNLILLLKKM
jgi:hypothetical protein